MVNKEGSTSKDESTGTRVPHLGITPDVVEYLEEVIAKRLANNDRFADDVSDKALNKVYQAVGKSVIRKAAWAVGVIIIGLLGWLGYKGGIK